MTHHRRGLRRLIKDDALVDRLEKDFRSAGLDNRRLTMLSYVEKLTVSPSDVSHRDVGALKGAGFDDADVLAIAEVTAYYAYVNRIADGLGVEVESWFTPD